MLRVWLGGPKASQISDLRRTEKWRHPLEEVREEDDLLTGEESKLFQSVAARFNFFCHGQARPLVLSERVDAENGFTTCTRPHFKRVARYTIKYKRMSCIYPWTQLDNNTEVFGDANFAGSHSTRKSTVEVSMRSGQFVKAWSKTMGVLALSSGESELAAVVRAATAGLGLQSILSDFSLCGHVAIKSDATPAIGMVHRLGSGKVRHLAVGDL